MSTLPATRDDLPQLSSETLARLVLHGDMSRLTDKQKAEYYISRCEALGLNPASKPFEYLKLRGRRDEPDKEILYATKACTDQLSGLFKLKVEIIGREMDRDLGIFTAQARVTFPDGRTVEDIGSVGILSFKGDNILTGDFLANALMKAVTKAKRRTILSALGLGMLDETEIETIPNAERYNRPMVEDHDPSTGQKQLVDPTKLGPSERAKGVPGGKQGEQDIQDVQTYLRAKVEDFNARWADYWTDRYGGEIPPGFPSEVLNGHQLSGHLQKYFKGPKVQNWRHKMEFLGQLFREQSSAFDAETEAYGNRIVTDAIGAKEAEFEEMERKEREARERSEDVIDAEYADADPDLPDTPEAFPDPEDAEIARQAARDANPTRSRASVKA